MGITNVSVVSRVLFVNLEDQCKKHPASGVSVTLQGGSPAWKLATGAGLGGAQLGLKASFKWSFYESVWIIHQYAYKQYQH